MKLLAKITLCSIFIGLCLTGRGQNLVPNGSFEDMISCPTWSGIDEFVVGWTNPTAYSPDYFNACVTIMNGYGVPQNGWGFQNARTGIAYVGLISMIETDGREYIQAELTEPLIAGKKYLVTFYVSLAEKCTYASNNIGAYFSNIPVSSTNLWVLPYTPQISNNHLLNPLTDTLSWVKVSDTLIAIGGEKHITIGNFNDDTSTDTTHKPVLPSPWWNGSYHYIDDVSVVCIDCSVGISETNIKSRITVFPNPATNHLSVSFENVYPERITLFSSIGEALLVQKQVAGNNSMQIEISQFHSGIYYLKIEAKEFSLVKKFVITK
jgi:hypothetical protein